jgi:hypothetical protein
MTERRTRDSLGIFWSGEEVDGILVYGLWLDPVHEPPDFPSASWPLGTEWKATWLGDSGWRVLLWDIRPAGWPKAEKWGATIRATLQALKAAGAKVAWCGLEGFFVDPPNLFETQHMGESVWAVLDAEGVLHGPPSLDGPFETVPSNILELLRKQTGVEFLGDSSPPGR